MLGLVIVCFNLEEIDQLFEADLPAWKFQKYETGGLTHELAMRENNQTSAKAVDDEPDVEGQVEHAQIK